MDKKTLWKLFVISILISSLICCLLGLYFLKTEDKIKINDKIVEEIVKYGYAPKDKVSLNEKKAYYIENGLITQDVANNLFTIDETTFGRSIEISDLDFSDRYSNSYGDDLYKVHFRLDINDVSTNCEVVLFINEDGTVYKFTFGIL